MADEGSGQNKDDENRLRIRAGSLDMEFNGDADYVERAYEATRKILLECFRQCLREHAPVDEKSSESTKSSTQLLFNIDKEDIKPVENGHANVILIGDLYHKICLLERDKFDKSILRNIFVFEAIEDIYVPIDQSDRFRETLKFGKVLWRELTTRGREAVRESK